MKKFFLPFVLFFVLTSCFCQKNEITEQILFEDFLKSDELKDHFINKTEIYIFRDKNLCEKIDCEKTYISHSKKVNLFDKADFFSRGLREYAIINKFDKVKNKVDFSFHE